MEEDNIRDISKFLEDDKMDGRVAANSTEQSNLYPKNLLKGIVNRSE